VTDDTPGPAHTSRDVAFDEMRRRYQLSADDEFGYLVLVFPRNLISLSVNDLTEFTARWAPGRQGIGALVAPLLADSTQQAQTDELLSTNFELSSAVINLVAAAFSEEHRFESQGPSNTHRIALILRIKEFVDARLGNPALTSSNIAAANHISPRYLQKLFEAEGTTVTDWVRTRRLERCRRDLRDPRLAGTSIGTIAARWGFMNASYFSRLFKTAYGIAPRDFRAQAIQDQMPSQPK
jgi:AraC-like DNA-binding protein